MKKGDNNLLKTFKKNEILLPDGRRSSILLNPVMYISAPTGTTYPRCKDAGENEK